MPALKIDQEEAKPEPEPEPQALLAPTPEQRQPSTKMGFRALSAVELDASAVGDGSMQSAAPADVRSTQFGTPSPFKPGDIPDPNAHNIDEPAPPPSAPAPRAAPEPVAPAEPTPAILSTQFGAPSPFKAGQVPDPNAQLDEAPQEAPSDAIMSTQFGAPSPFKAKAGEDPAPAAEPIASTRMGMPSVNLTGAAEAPAADDYSTLVGPPLPVAEAARAREAAVAAIAEAEPDNYRTLVGPPVPIAEAARKRDAARGRNESAARNDARSGQNAGPSIIVDQRSINHEFEAKRGPSIIVDPGIGDGESFDIVDEPVPARAPSKAPAEGRVRSSDQAERAAAARFAAAIAEDDERTQMVGTVTTGRPIWVFVVIVLVGLALAIWLAREAYAVQPTLDGVEAVVVGDAVQIVARIDAPDTVSVDHPEGRMVVEGAGEVRFRLGAESLSPGVHRVALNVSGAGGERVLPIGVNAWARAEIQAVDTLDAPVVATLDVATGWTPEVESTQGVVERQSDGRYRVTLDPERARAAVDTVDGLTAPLTVPVTLRGADGQTRRLELKADVPLAQSPLVLDNPPHRWRRDAERVRVAGRTAPGAVIRVQPGDARTTAGFDGRFSMYATLGADREQRLEVIADADGRRPTVARIKVERISPDEVKRQAEALAAEGQQRFGELGPAPKYAKMAAADAALRDRPVALRGRLVTVRRGPYGADRAVVSVCEGGDRCPIWVETVDPVLADTGEWVTAIGRLSGTETYRSRDDRFLTVPRIEGALLVP